MNMHRLANGALVAGALSLVAAVGLRLRPGVAQPAASTTPLPPGTRIASPDAGLPHAWSDSTDRLLFFFTAECPWCRVSIPRWSEIVAGVDQRRVVLVPVSLSDSASTASVVRATGLRPEAVRPADPRAFSRRWHVQRVPLLILTTADGRVQRAWPGLIDSATVTDVVRTIGRASAAPPRVQESRDANR